MGNWPTASKAVNKYSTAYFEINLAMFQVIKRAILFKSVVICLRIYPENVIQKIKKAIGLMMHTEILLKNQK